MSASLHRWALALPLCLGTLVGCGEGEPAVEWNTYVGPSYEQHDEQAQREHATAVAQAVLAELAPAPAAERDPAQEPIPVVVHAPTDARELDALLKALAEAPLEEIGGPARRLAAAPPEVWPRIREVLLAERKSPKGDYRSLLDAIGGDVPNRYGHFARAWKKAHGHQVKLSENWFEDLLLLPTGRISRGLRPVYRDCVRTTALLQAASGIGREDPALTGEVVATLLDAAYLHQGTFRDEVGRAIAGIGDEAIPHLLVESTSAADADEDSDPARRAEYAQVQLDRTDRLHPARATEAVRDDPRLLALVLHAYGTVRPGEAAPVLLDFVDLGDPTVRAAARAAFMAYVNGPPPQASHRKIRLLGGGTANARAHLTYRQRAALAIRQRLETEAPALLEPECEQVRENGSIDRHCEAQPERLAEQYFAWLDARRAQEDQQALAAALAEPDVQRRVERLDRLLVGNPELTVGPQLVPVYREAAEDALREGQAARAGQLLRKAGRLVEREDPEASRELRVRALLAEASLPGLTPEGRAMLLASAAELSPDDPRIDEALSRARAPARGDGIGHARERWAPATGMLVGLWGLGLMGSWWRRRKTRRSR